MNDLQTVRNDIQIAPAAMPASTALAQVEQSRAVAEVQASLVLARANPRNEQVAEYKIMNSCKRKSLAECASYSFRRGGEIVTGASIRLAEEIARHWGNMQYGFREVGRQEDCSEVEAFAHDLETNVRVTRQFQVRHWRDTKQGGKKITEERDKYELVANMAQRRVRACLLELIPGDIVEAAEEACKATLVGAIGDPKEKVKSIVAAFAPLGVTEEMIEGFLQRKLASIVPADIVNLQRIYRSIRDGVAAVDEFFKAEDVAKLNERFSGKGKTNHQQEPLPENPTEATPPRQAELKEEQQQEAADSAPDKQEQDDKAPDSGAKAPSARVLTFMKEINQAATGGSIAVDTWRSKHHKRVANACGGTGSDDFKEIMDYADMIFKELEESEKEASANQQVGGVKNGSLF